VESDLADKDAMRELQLKKNQQYSEADYKRLESLMYDKVILKLEAAQVTPYLDYGFMCSSTVVYHGH